MTIPAPETFLQCYARRVHEADLLHVAMFDLVEDQLGLRPWIEQTGGMTMTITLRLPLSDGVGAGYLGLVEGVNEDGTWCGSLSYYADLEDTDDEGIALVMAYPGYEDSTHSCLSPQGFAQVLIDHYRARN